MCFGLFLTTDLAAQESNYDTQIEALRESFAKRSIQSLKQHLSEELTFLTYPASATGSILNQLFANLPELTSLETVETKPGTVSLSYTFSSLGKRESNIHFDGMGRITGIELVDNILKEQQEAQEALRESVQQPEPGALGEKYPPRKVRFVAGDGLEVTGNLYEVDPEAPVILLCHQGNFNKFEYADIAPKLNAMGYNALAIDQRAGGSFAGRPNETYERARAEGLADITFLDAEQDIKAGVDFLHQKYNRKIIVWGSSYSASLVLHIAGRHELIEAAIAFSPGDYFEDRKPSLSDTFSKLDTPFFVTSAPGEIEDLAGLLADIELTEKQVHFVPEGTGYHGSRTLWTGQEGAEDYWIAIREFLSGVYPGE